MPTYAMDLTVLASPYRNRGIGRYAAQLWHALRSIKDGLNTDERLVALVQTSTGPVFTEEVDLQLINEAPIPSMQAYLDLRRSQIEPALLSEAPDVVHAPAGPVAMISSKFPTVVTCMDLIPLRMPHIYLRRWGQRWKQKRSDRRVYGRAQKVIAISKATSDDLDELLGIGGQRVSVIWLGVDLERFHPHGSDDERQHVRARYNLPDRYVLYVGETDLRKRVHLLVEAHAAVFEETGVRLVIAGKDPTRLGQEVKDAIAAAPEGAVAFTGFVADEDMPALYRHAVAHAFVSVYEGFGLTILEAMAAGCPVITTRCTSLAEVAGEAARFVEKDDVPQLRQALREVIGDASVRDRLRAGGLARAQDFGWDETARQTLQVYREVADMTPSANRR